MGNKHHLLSPPACGAQQTHTNWVCEEVGEHIGIYDPHSPVRALPWCRPARHVPRGFPPRVGLASHRLSTQAHERYAPPSLWPSPPMTRTGQGVRTQHQPWLPPLFTPQRGARHWVCASRNLPSQPHSREWSTRIGGPSSRGQGVTAMWETWRGPS